MSGPRDVSSALESVTNLAFEAALAPALWSDVVRGIVDLLDGDKGIMLNQGDSRAPATLPAAGFDRPMVERYFADYEVINPIQRRLWSVMRHDTLPRFHTDQHLVERSELVRSDFYNEYLRPIAIHTVIAIHFGIGQGSLNVMRPATAGDFGETETALVDSFFPSVRGAYLLARRLGAGRGVGEALTSFVDRLPSAVALCDAEARVLYANEAATALLARSDGLSCGAQALRAANAEAGRRLAELIARAATNGAHRPCGGAFAAPRPSGCRPFAVTVAPARAEGGGGVRLAMVTIEDPERTPAAPHDQLRAVFGLTRAEALTVADLVGGHEPKEIAARRGVKISNIRSQLSSALAKTDTVRQAELVSLVIRTIGRFQ